MIVYKVVDTDRENFYSAFARKEKVSYEIEKTSFPKLEGSMLFAFKELDLARKYAKISPFFTILKCKTPKAKPIPWGVAVDVPRDRLRRFWKLFREGKKTRGASHPRGSVACEHLTPLEIVK